ncbi:MAG TPA: hypothetical protein VM261_37690 [Kofleriaceae bacterium]|nr:hypothetical protein [Kofleriaceae bacterium]
MRIPVAFVIAVWLGLGLGFASACGSEPRGPITPSSRADDTTPTAASSPTGTVVVRLGGDFPDLRFPLTVRHARGETVIPDGGEHRVDGVPASEDELTRVEIEGWRPIWVHVPPGGETWLSSHACCGVTFDSNTYDDAIATCAPPGGTCPIDVVEVPHSLAADPVCGDRPRCVPRSKLRVVQARSGAEITIVDENGEVYRAGEEAGLVYPNIADMFTFAVDGSDQRQDVAMDRGATYSIFLDGAAVTRVSATRW